MDGVFFAVLLFLVHPAAVSTNEPRNGACRDNREEFGFALIGHDYKSFHADNFGRCFFECSILMKYAKAQRFSGTVKNVK